MSNERNDLKDFEIDGTTIVKYKGNSKRVVIPDGVTQIGSEAFYCCSSITSVILPEGVTSIEAKAFEFCDNLTSVKISSSVTSIGRFAFRYCKSLTSIVIPDSVKVIEDWAFSECKELTRVTLSKAVTTIERGVFDGCSALTHIKIPNGVTSIGYGAFYDCKNLTNIEIPNSVTSIDRYAFRYCKSLTSIVIPDRVKVIEGSAFSECKELTRVTLSKAVTTIESEVFTNCENLTSVIIPDGVTRIKAGAFRACAKLSGVSLPRSLASIDASVFADCVSLADITYRGTESEWQSIEKPTGWDYNTGRYTVHCTDGDIAAQKSTAYNEADFEIQDTTLVKYNGTGEKVVIPDFVTDVYAVIDDYGLAGFAFIHGKGDGKRVKSVVVPASITDIDGLTFHGCPNLEEITVDPENEKYYSEGNCIIERESKTLIVGCKNSVIPQDVKSIGFRAFCTCDELTEITYNGTKAQWLAVEDNERRDEVFMGVGGSANGCIVHCIDGDIVKSEGTDGGNSGDDDDDLPF